MKRHLLLSACRIAALSGILFALPAQADTITVRGSENKNVKVIAIRQGSLYYRTARGDERNALLQDVSAIQLDQYPQLTVADKAFDEGKFEAAAKTYAPLADKAEEEFVRVLAGVKLVAALDRAGQFDAAVARYAKLLALDNSALTQSAKPRNAPKEKDARAASAAKAQELAKTTGDPIAKQFLNETIEQLKSEAAAEPSGNLEAQSGLLRTREEARLDPIDLALKEGKHAQVLELTGKMLASGEGVAPRLLYQRGLALAATEKDMDAMLAFMRIAVHFPNSSYTRLGLVEAGKLYKKQEKPAQARKVWTEAQALADAESEEAKEIETLLASLPGKN